MANRACLWKADIAAVAIVDHAHVGEAAADGAAGQRPGSAHTAGRSAQRRSRARATSSLRSDDAMNGAPGIATTVSVQSMAVQAPRGTRTERAVRSIGATRCRGCHEARSHPAAERPAAVPRTTLGELGRPAPFQRTFSARCRLTLQFIRNCISSEWPGRPREEQS